MHAGSDLFSHSLVCRWLPWVESHLKLQMRYYLLSVTVFLCLHIPGFSWDWLHLECVLAACDIRQNKASLLSSLSLALYLCFLLLVFQRNAGLNSSAGLEQQSSHKVWTSCCCIKFKDEKRNYQKLKGLHYPKC